MNAAGAVAPNIFDVRAEPEILHALILANELSPRLWSLAERIGQLEPDPGDDVPAYARGAQRVLDRYFTHLTPTQVIEIDGVLDLDAEAGRLGADVVERSVESIAETFRWRIARGYSQPDDPGLALIAERRFPAYTYGELDTLHAYRRQLRRKSGRPIGLTSCLDEAALFGALLMGMPGVERHSIVVLAQPAHYTVFGWLDGVAWWFYGKNRLHSARQHADLIATEYDGDPVFAFGDVMAQFDRVITRRGTCDFVTGESSIPREELVELSEQLEPYFQFVPEPMRRALDDGLRHVPPSPFDELFARCIALDSCDAVRDEVRTLAREATPLGAAANAVLACHRSLAVGDPSVFLPAAREGARLREARAQITSLDDALQLVRGIERTDSMFDDSDRIAMPEEVLVLGTATDRDRALLLHVLLESLSGAPVTTVITANDAIVHSAFGSFGGPGLQPIDDSALPEDVSGRGGLIVRLAQ